EDTLARVDRRRLAERVERLVERAREIVVGQERLHLPGAEEDALHLETEHSPVPGAREDAAHDIDHHGESVALVTAGLGVTAQRWDRAARPEVARIGA